MHRALLCSAPPKLQNTSKRRERNYTASCGASRKPNTRERKREEKKILRKEKERRKEAEVVSKEKRKTSEQKREREQKIQKSLKEDLWFGKGVASALTK